MQEKTVEELREQVLIYRLLLRIVKDAMEANELAGVVPCQMLELMEHMLEKEE
jgi:hypothetical protein